MKKAWLLVWLAAGAHVAAAQELLRSPLPPLPAGHEVRIDNVTLDPDSSVPAHRHNAYVYVVVTEGTVEMQVAGKAVQRLTEGQVFTENPDDVHTLMRNPSTTQPARFVSFVIKRADASAFVPVTTSAER